MTSIIELTDKNNKADLTQGNFISDTIHMNVYQIRYMYKTQRNNLKEKITRVFSGDKLDAKYIFLNYISEFNKQHPYRAIANVNILDIKPISCYNITFED